MREVLDVAPGLVRVEFDRTQLDEAALRPAPEARKVAGTGKPMIISTGMADADEISEAVAAARDGGCRGPALRHCVGGYPAPPGARAAHPPRKKK